jgi:hypothetical protein
VLNGLIASLADKVSCSHLALHLLLGWHVAGSGHNMQHQQFYASHVQWWFAGSLALLLT